MRLEDQSTRRDLLRYGMMGALGVAGAKLLRADTGSIDTQREFEEWRYAPLDHPIEYPANWTAALNRLGLSKTSEIRCYHRADSLRSAKRACHDPAIQQIEVDLRSRDGRVVAAHGIRSRSDMDIDEFHLYVSQASREKLIKYDFKSFPAYLESIRSIAEFNRDRPHILNMDLFQQYSGELTPRTFADNCAIYPTAIWSVGFDGRFDETVVTRIIILYSLAEGNFTLPIRANVYEKNHKVLAEAVRTGVHFTVYNGNGDMVPDSTKRLIMNTIPPWQVTCDFR